MKTIILIAIIATLGSATYFQSCSRTLCSKQYDNCNSDKACLQVVSHCQATCTSDNACLQQCFFQSNSLIVQRLAQCSTTQKCFPNDKLCKVECPNSCVTPVSKGEKECEAEYDGVAYYQCIVDYVKEQGRDDCADKNCVCSNTLSLGIYVAGCQC